MMNVMTTDGGIRRSYTLNSMKHAYNQEEEEAGEI